MEGADVQSPSPTKRLMMESEDNPGHSLCTSTPVSNKRGQNRSGNSLDNSSFHQNFLGESNVTEELMDESQGTESLESDAEESGLVPESPMGDGDKDSSTSGLPAFNRDKDRSRSFLGAVRSSGLRRESVESVPSTPELSLYERVKSKMQQERKAEKDEPFVIVPEPAQMDSFSQLRMSQEIQSDDELDETSDTEKMESDSKSGSPDEVFAAPAPAAASGSPSESGLTSDIKKRLGLDDSVFSTGSPDAPKPKRELEAGSFDKLEVRNLPSAKKKKGFGRVKIEDSSDEEEQESVAIEEDSVLSKKGRLSESIGIVTIDDSDDDSDFIPATPRHKKKDNKLLDDSDDREMLEPAASKPPYSPTPKTGSVFGSSQSTENGMSAASAGYDAEDEETVELIENPDLRRQLEAQKRKLEAIISNKDDADLLPNAGREYFNQLDHINKSLATLAPLPPEPTLSQVYSERERALSDIPGSSSNTGNDVIVKPPDLGRELWERQFAVHPVLRRLYGGQQTHQRMVEASIITNQRTKLIHDALTTCPAETDMAEQPKGIKVDLMVHQLQGLKWMLWREGQVPPGGILADDMGLGKTLSMISLILESKNRRMAEKENKGPMTPSERDKARVIREEDLIPSNATLIVTPASVVRQWEAEVEKRVRPGRLRVLVFHGAKRDVSAKRMANYDIVLSTYGTVSSEIPPEKVEDLDGDNTPDHKGKKGGPSVLVQIAWARLILDEGHEIKNHTAQKSRACCRIPAASRWSLSGTPIHNDLKDLYSQIRFLRVSPFDELAVWKVYIHRGARNEALTENQKKRLDALVKSVLLRRTKQMNCNITQKPLVDLPPKRFVEVMLPMHADEWKVYDVLFEYAKTRCKTLLMSDKERAEELRAVSSGMATHEELGYRNPFKIKRRAKPDMEEGSNFAKFTELFTILLRLRQTCAHMALAKEALDMEAFKQDAQVEGVEEGRLAEGQDLNDSRLDLDGVKTESNAHIFEKKWASTKVKALIEMICDVRDQPKEDSTGRATYDKCIVVSQWTSLLDIVAYHLTQLGIATVSINGTVPVKDRQPIVDSFNTPNRGPPVMLLSLTAGGVGLNLIGGNHMFLLDLHWNPALEKQAFDRIHRMGQKKNVFVHKLMCEKTFERNVLALQQSKLEVAKNALEGGKNVAKLTLKDLRFLFDLDKENGEKAHPARGLMDQHSGSGDGLDANLPNPFPAGPAERFNPYPTANYNPY